MSADEDTELRDLVAQTLEANGVLGKIRAQLRASVFLALEEQESVQNKTPFLNQELKKFMTSKEGRLVTSLVREFLDFFNLEFTATVFDPESGYGEKYEGREALARELNIIDAESTLSTPLLAEVIKRQGSETTGRPKSSHGEFQDDSSEFIRIPKDLSAKHIADARRKFDEYDKDKSGTIEKDELRSLFTDMFPHFHKNMLERYVNDEFKAVDKDFSNAIDFDEFLSMYKRLFVLCKSVVSHDISDIMPASPRRLADVQSPTKIPVKKGGQVNGASQGNKHTNVVENKNKKNLEHSPRLDDSFGKDKDPFFDDMFPKGDKSHGRRNSGSKGANSQPQGSHSKIPVLSPGGSSTTEKSKDGKSSQTSQAPAKDAKQSKPGGAASSVSGAGGGLSSLKDLPSLGGDKGSPLGSLQGAPPLPGVTKEKKQPDLNNTADLENDLKAIDKRIADLGFELPDDDDDDYEDDFQSSHNSQSHKSNKSQSQSQSIAEEIEESIEEDISGADDLLRSEQSGLDDMTTDRTLSPQNVAGEFDYIEDILAP